MIPCSTFTSDTGRYNRCPDIRMLHVYSSYIETILISDVRFDGFAAMTEGKTWPKEAIKAYEKAQKFNEELRQKQLERLHYRKHRRGAR